MSSDSSDWTAAAGALLEPGENLLAAEQMRLPGGVIPKPAEPAAGTPLSVPGKVGAAFLHVVSPNISLPGPGLLERLLFGVAAGGPPGCLAGTLFRTELHAAVGRWTVLVVTDRRLLVAVTPKRNPLSWAEDPREPLEPIWSVPRSGVHTAGIERYRLRRRLRIAFADGSWGAFQPAPGESADRAHRLAVALST